VRKPCWVAESSKRLFHLLRDVIRCFFQKRVKNVTLNKSISMDQHDHIKIMMTWYEIAKKRPQVTFINDFQKTCHIPKIFTGTFDLSRLQWLKVWFFTIPWQAVSLLCLKHAPPTISPNWQDKFTTQMHGFIPTIQPEKQEFEEKWSWKLPYLREIQRTKLEVSGQQLKITNPKTLRSTKGRC
jgi:hypothetical protein